MSERGSLDRRGFLSASAGVAAAAAVLPSQLAAQPVDIPADTPSTIEQIPSGFVMRRGPETVRVTVCAADVIHVVAGPGNPTGASPQTPWFVEPEARAEADFAQTAEKATLRTPKLTVEADLKRGLLRFLGPDGKPLLQESDRVQRRYWPHQANGESLYRVDQRFFPDALEGIYGLGQHQEGVLDQRGTVIELAQANTNIAIPFFVSTMGYGLLWNTASKSWFDNRFPSELKLTAEAADAIDYYVFYGPSIGRLIQIYRKMTGDAPLFGRWAYGFIQSKDRYRSAKQLLDIAAEYRDQHVPLDMIVQDWFWWRRQGDPQYSAEYLAPWPDVPAALAKLHSENVHAMISVWAKMDPQSENYAAMKQLGLLVPETDIYDATNPAARDYYWKHLMGVKFAEGWDGFWLDSSEPEIWNGQSDASLDAKRLHIGNGARYTNIFPLMHSGGVHDHWRETTDRKRVFILTRSGFLGQQRNAAVVWSGDVIGSWMTFRRQITAGLNYQMSGLPYWTTDIAGYGWPYERDTRDPAYQELYTRWFQYGVFCPILRTHGHRSNDTNELFSYGPVTPILIDYEKLRYRLLPYIYSLAWRVTNGGYTMQRALPMDWPADQRVRDIGDQFMFGPAFLVAPVTEAGATERSVYLPPATGWYDFWTGQRFEGAKTLVAATPLDRLPLYVRAGSIVPLGPLVENADGQVAELEVRVYPGADADFDYYSDSGDSYDYEKGQRRVIPMHWDDAARTLTLGKAQGGYPGMPKSLHIRLVVVTENHGGGSQMAVSKGGEALYTGSELRIRSGY
ncbi:MAG TPA: TIM-barrel domain-containing protein [Sphingomicrobium sp.]|nr:TIM-barrel domain-containing protein [Sphingomicrobium sp.]